MKLKIKLKKLGVSAVIGCTYLKFVSYRLKD